MLATSGNEEKQLISVTQMLPGMFWVTEFEGAGMAKALTKAGVEKLKADPKRRLEIPDGLLTGLYLVIQPSGKKSWAVRYRHFSKPKKMVLGAYPAFDLPAARKAAQEALRKVQQGNDPASEKQTAKKLARDTEEADRLKFGNIVRTFITRHAKVENRSWRETARTLGLVADKSRPDLRNDPKAFVMLKGGLVEKWGYRPITDITRAEIIAWLDTIVDRGSPIMANRVFAALRKLFNWAISRDLIQDSPCAGIKPPAKEMARDRVLSDDEIKTLWRGCEKLGYPFGAMFKLLLVTGQRREEVAALTWKELDLENALWTIPRTRVKNNKEHTVPLNACALALLRNLPRISQSEFVFTTTGMTPASGISKAKARLDDFMVAKLDDGADGFELADWRLHDLRRTVASGMARLGINLPVIEKILNHTSGSFGGIVGVYQRHEFSDEKARALEAWGSFVEELVEGKRDNVVSLGSARAGS